MARSSTDRSQGSALKRRLLVGLAATSLLVFVLGSFVFVCAFLYPAAALVASAAISGPAAGVVSILPAIPVASAPNAPGRVSADTPATQQRRTNFLLLGIDQRDDEKGVPTRSDTIMVVSLDQTNKTAAMISFARDLWVPIPGYADNRINVPNFLGDAYKYPGGGPALAEKTIEQDFGLDIDYYARVDFRGFEKIVDTLGGIDVDVERAILDEEYPTEDYETMRIYIPAGRQHMNGKVALEYARSRHSENDFGRARRQQKVLLAIRDRAVALDVIPKLPALVGTLWNMVQTDVPPAEFIRLASVAKEIDARNVSTLVIDDKLSQPYVGEGGADLLLPDVPAIRKAIGGLLADPAVKSEGAKIEVINGTGKAGLATRTGEFLSTHGFDVVKVSTGDRADYAKTMIVVTGGAQRTAGLLASTLGVAPGSIAPGATSSGPEIRVILGSDFALP
ncbi:MAG TPA: LCP family protein [Chloroflexota bacterium]